MATHVKHVDSPGDHDRRGRTAEHPSDIPSRGWWDIAVRVKREMNADNVSIVAAGLALYALLALFPALAAAVSMYGLFASPDTMASHLQQIATMLPADATRIVQQQLTDLSHHQNRTLSFGVVLGILVALWSARKGMVALITVMNVAYDEQERRGFFRRLFLSSAFTLGAVMGFLAVLVLGVAVPVVLSFLPLGPAAEIVVLAVRWAVLFGIAVLGLAIVYRFGPDRRGAQWKWITPGSFIAAVLWLIGSALFSVYARNWGAYGKTYGTLGGVVVMLMWLYLSGYIVFLGAEINAEIERQTKKDTTTGQPKPMGERGAYAADTIGPSADEMRRGER